MILHIYFGPDAMAGWVEDPPPILGDRRQLGLNCGRVKPMTLKLILAASWSDAQYYYDREWTGWLSVRKM